MILKMDENENFELNLKKKELLIQTKVESSLDSVFISNIIVKKMINKMYGTLENNYFDEKINSFSILSSDQIMNSIVVLKFENHDNSENQEMSENQINSLNKKLKCEGTNETINNREDPIQMKKILHIPLLNGEKNNLNIKQGFSMFQILKSSEPVYLN